MATMKPYKELCAEGTCKQRAMWDVAGQDGRSVGKFCSKHANARCVALSKSESEPELEMGQDKS